MHVYFIRKQKKKVTEKVIKQCLFSSLKLGFHRGLLWFNMVQLGFEKRT